MMGSKLYKGIYPEYTEFINLYKESYQFVNREAISSKEKNKNVSESEK